MPDVSGTVARILQWLGPAVGRGEPFVLGLSAPQGGGKSTLAAALVAAVAERGRRGVTLSVDDVYLTHDEQRALAARHPGDRTLEHRGYPGTHDTALGHRSLAALRAGADVALPRYDKSAHGGRGDRAPASTWPRVHGPVDLVIFEGWMLGFAPVPAPPRALAAANGLLAGYAPWGAALDAFVHFRAGDPEDVVRWRLDAEQARRARGEPTLSDADTLDYIRRFLPAYETWVPPLWEHGPRGPEAPPLPRLRATLGADRRPRGWIVDGPRPSG